MIANEKHALFTAILLLLGLLFSSSQGDAGQGANADGRNEPEWDSTKKSDWPAGFKVVEIPSTLDGELQRAYVCESGQSGAQPLVVSLHSWSATYEQKDPLAPKMQAAGFHYIHPDFRGGNTRPEACASDLALQDIDDAISHCLANWDVDSERIYIFGASGGGHAACAAYFKSAHPVAAFFAWVPITDLEEWYLQSRQRRSKYAKDIEKVCGGGFVPVVAAARSPMHMPIPDREGRLHLYAGIEDGYNGSVPISHSIHLYNRLAPPERQVDAPTFVRLLTKAVEPTGNRIQNKEVWHHSESQRASLTIFEGGHETLVEHAADQMINYKRN